MFESENPENAMKMIQLLIGILGKVKNMSYELLTTKSVQLLI